jgi:hypothetical protein
MNHCVYGTPSECSRSYIWEIGIAVGIGTGKCNNNLKRNFCEEVRTHSTCTYDKCVGAERGRKLWHAMEHNIICRKYREFAHMTCVTNTVSQPILEIFPMWISHIQGEECATRYFGLVVNMN